MRVYRCQLCGDTSVVGDPCPRCLVPMIDEAHAHHIRFGARSLRNKWIKYYALAYFVIHVIVNVWLNLWLIPRGWDAGTLLMPGCLVLTVLAAALLYAFGKGGNARAAKRMERWPANRPVTSIGAAGEGPVAIRGRVRSGDAVFEADGKRAVAGTRVRHDGHLSPALITRATEFIVEDDTGERAVVRASEVVVIGGVEVDGEQLVPDGALVEIAGEGVRNIATDREGGYRSDLRTFELSGTPAEPLVIRVIEVPKSAARPKSVASAESTGVRVAVDSPSDTIGGEEREAEVSAAAAKSAHS